VSELQLLSDAQMRRIEPYFPLSHGVPRVDDRLILSGIGLPPWGDPFGMLVHARSVGHRWN
jgi:transposase